MSGTVLGRKKENSLPLLSLHLCKDIWENKFFFNVSVISTNKAEKRGIRERGVLFRDASPRRCL